jgi:hypothetical protein
MNKCIKCKTPNPEQWFYCKTCGEKTAMNNYTSNLWMRGDLSSRTDVEFSSMDMNSHVDQLVSERETKGRKFWQDVSSKATN